MLSGFNMRERPCSNVNAERNFPFILVLPRGDAKVPKNYARSENDETAPIWAASFHPSLAGSEAQF